MSNNLFESKLDTTDEEVHKCCGEYVAGSRCPTCPDRTVNTKAAKPDHFENLLNDIEGYLKEGRRPNAIGAILNFAFSIITDTKFTDEVIKPFGYEVDRSLNKISSTKQKSEEIDFDKPLRTRDGRNVRILKTDLKSTSTCSVVAAVSDSSGEEVVIMYDKFGKTSGLLEKEFPSDLVNIEEKKEDLLNIVMSLISSSSEIESTFFGHEAEGGYVIFKNGDQCRVYVHRSDKLNSFNVTRRWVNVFDNFSVGKTCSTYDAADHLASETSLNRIGKIRLIFEDYKLVDVGLEKLDNK